MQKRLIVLGLALVFFFVVRPLYAYEILNIDELRRQNGLSGITANTKNLENLKIAILDEGFEGYPNPASTPPLLPHCTEYIEGPKKAEEDPFAKKHGLRMAQIVYSMMGLKDPSICAPKMYLVQTNGYSNFKAAIDFIVREKIDLVVFSMNWEHGGNFDGEGFINAEVTRALDAGAIWVNAAGNYRNLVYDQKIKTDEPGEIKDIEFESLVDENPLRIVLSWDDYTNDETFTTDEDLDLTVIKEEEDGNEIEVAWSRKIQDGKPRDLKNPDDQRSGFARETIVLDQNKQLMRGKYILRVEAKSAMRFSKNFRITLTPKTHNTVRFLNPSVRGEIMNPASHPGVITVGDLSPVSARGPTRDGVEKPNILIQDSNVNYSTGFSSFGTSEAAAIYAGVLAVLKSNDMGLNFDGILKLIKSKRPPKDQECFEPLTQVEFKAKFEDIVGATLPSLPYIDSGWMVGKIYNKTMKQDFLYVYTPVEPQGLPPFNLDPRASASNADSSLYLLGTQKSLIVDKEMWQNFGPEYIRFTPERLALPRCLPEKTTVWF